MSGSSAKTPGQSGAEARLVPDSRLARVALSFAAVYAVLQTVVWWLSYAGYFAPLTEFTARIAGACTNAVGIPARVGANQIFLATRVLRIDLDCTGISLMLVYTALVLAYPIGIRSRLLGLAAGIPVLALANLLRLVAVAELAPLSDDSFFFLHDYLFKVLMIAIVIVVWASYMAWARRDAQRG